MLSVDNLIHFAMRRTSTNVEVNIAIVMILNALGNIFKVTAYISVYSGAATNPEIPSNAVVMLKILLISSFATTVDMTDRSIGLETYLKSEVAEAR